MAQHHLARSAFGLGWAKVANQADAGVSTPVLPFLSAPSRVFGQPCICWPGSVSGASNFAFCLPRRLALELNQNYLQFTTGALREQATTCSSSCASCLDSARHCLHRAAQDGNRGPWAAAVSSGHPFSTCVHLRTDHSFRSHRFRYVCASLYSVVSDMRRHHDTTVVLRSFDAE